MTYFPTSEITGIPKTRFHDKRDYEAITDTWTYEDGSTDANEVTDNAPYNWEYFFTGLTPAQAQVYEDFFNTVRLSQKFYFTDKFGVTYSNVKVKSYTRNWDAHKSWVMTVEFNLVGENSQIITIVPPIVTLSSAITSGTDVVISGNLTETLGSADVQLYFNGTIYGSPVNKTAGAFTLSLPLADLFGGTNSFSVTAVNAQGGFDTSNTITFDNTPDPYPPSKPVIYSISGTLTSEMLIQWYPSSDEEAFGAGDDDDYLLF